MLANRQVLMVAVCLVMVAMPGVARRDDEFQQVQAKDLVKNPQFYWAQGFIFRDTIESIPSAQVRRMGERQVVQFRTKIVGECFADASMGSELQVLQAGAECLFSGTVYQERGWFSSRFHVIVQSVTPAARGLTSDAQAAFSNLFVAASNTTHGATSRRLNFVLSEIQSDLLATSKELGIPMAELVNPDSPNREKLMNAIRRGVLRLEEESRAPSSLFLSELLAAMLAAQYQRPAAPSAPIIEVVTNIPEVPASKSSRDSGKKRAPQVEKGIKAEPVAVPSKVQPDEVKPVAHEASKVDATVQPPQKTGSRVAAKPTTNATAKVKVAEEKKGASFFGRLFGSGETKPKPPPVKNEVAPGAAKTAKTAEAKPQAEPVKPVVKRKSESEPVPVAKSKAAAKTPEDEPKKPARETTAIIVTSAPASTNVATTAATPKATPAQEEKKASFFGRLFGSDSTPKSSATNSVRSETNVVKKSEDKVPVDVAQAAAASKPVASGVGADKPVDVGEKKSVLRGATNETKKSADTSVAVVATNVPAKAQKTAAAPKAGEPSFFGRLFGFGSSTNAYSARSAKMGSNAVTKVDGKATALATQTAPQNTHTDAAEKKSAQATPPETKKDADLPVAIIATNAPSMTTAVVAKHKQEKPSFFGRLFGSSASTNIPAAKSTRAETNAVAKAAGKESAASVQKSPASQPVESGRAADKPVAVNESKDAAVATAPVMATNSTKSADATNPATASAKPKRSFFAKMFSGGVGDETTAKPADTAVPKSAVRPVSVAAKPVEVERLPSPLTPAPANTNDVIVTDAEPPSTQYQSRYGKSKAAGGKTP